MELVSPTIRYKQSYLAAVEEGKDETGITLIKKPKDSQSFEAFIQLLHDQAQGKQLPPGWVPATEYWLIDNDEFIGWVNIRHTLSPQLEKTGGHIGYWIRPSKRRKGYGKMLLALALPEAKKLGIGKALLTCDRDNMPSQKIIEACGGKLENIVDTGPNTPPKRRYWIGLSGNSEPEN